mmetsp:Transcript_115868/g.201603  ORF Transcript_115868/g.201603 Transcript_115868/m.201603 type:complete len:216 (+) Transcript_115868:2011-2658(+)
MQHAAGTCRARAAAVWAVAGQHIGGDVRDPLRRFGCRPAGGRRGLPAPTGIVCGAPEYSRREGQVGCGSRGSIAESGCVYQQAGGARGGRGGHWAAAGSVGGGAARGVCPEPGAAGSVPPGGQQPAHAGERPAPGRRRAGRGGGRRVEGLGGGLDGAGHRLRGDPSPDTGVPSPVPGVLPAAPVERPEPELGAAAMAGGHWGPCGDPEGRFRTCF